jgi:hypothetical protein
MILVASGTVVFRTHTSRQHVTAVAAATTTSIQPPGPSSTSTTTPPTSTSTTSVPVPGKPATFFAETKDQRIAIVSSTNGEVVRYLTDQQPGGGAGGFALSPDGKTLYFSRGLGTCAGQVSKLDLATGTEKALVPPPVTSAPPPTDGLEHSVVDGEVSVRPDGRALAFGRYHCDTRVADLVIVPLQPQGPEVIGPGLGQPLGPRSWTPDGSHVIVGTQDYNTGGSSWAAVDVAEDGTIGHSHPITTPSGACRFFIHLVNPSSGLLVASKSCGTQGPTLQVSLVEFDLSTERVVRTLVDGPAGQSLGPTTIDASGRFLLYETDKSRPPDAVISDSNPSPPPHEWLLVDGTSTPFPQADAYNGIDW